MNIKRIAKQSGLSPHTLRYYEKIDIIFGIERDASGHRFYNKNHLDWILFIKKLKAAGMSVADIRSYALMVKQGPDTAADRFRLLKAHKSKVEKKLAELQISLDLINFKVNHYRKIMEN